MNPNESTSGWHLRRAVHLVLAAVIALAFIGFFVGIDYGVPKTNENEPAPRRAVNESVVIPSTSYADLRATPIGPNRQWKNQIQNLPLAEGVVPTSDVVDPMLRRASLELRDERRAYNGAPPIIPHAVDQMSSDNCLACHGKDLRVENRVANAPPHPSFANCLQCHAPDASSPFTPTLLVNNTFKGVPAPLDGSRAWPGAPPVVPHSTFMRDNCLACHGRNGSPGLRTTHPERQQCLQCHAPSAELNQAVVAQGPMFLPNDLVESAQ